MTSIILAGGKGTRFGRDKVLEDLFNTTLLERVVECLSVYDGEIIIVTARDRLLPGLAGHQKIRITSDIYPDAGPLGGIHSGLKASNSFYNLVVACDMPFLNSALISYMMQKSYGFDLVIPRLNGMAEPLHAVYSKNCLSTIEDLLKQNRLSVLHLLSLVRVMYLEDGEIDRFDSEHLSFFNVNTEDDLTKAKNIFVPITEGRNRGLQNESKFLS